MIRWLAERAARRQAVADQVASSLCGEEQPSQAFCAAPTWRDRLQAALFPRPPLPEMPDDVSFVVGYLETHIVTSLDWKDRIRALITGQVHTCVRTKSNAVINKALSKAVTWVDLTRNPH